MAMGEPWIKDGPVDTEELAKTFKNSPIKFRFGSDSISLEKCFAIIADRINEAEKIKEQANKRIEQYEKEITADVRVQELLARVSELEREYRNSFDISATEEEKINKWKKEHEITQHNLYTLKDRIKANGAIGGRYKYSFIPTSIGTIGSCICCECENKIFQNNKGEKYYNKEMKKYNAEFIFSEL